MIGAANAGCIAGAVMLPPEGIGYVTVHAARSSFWGHPETVSGIEALGRAAARAGLGTLLVGDLSRRRGGPVPGGHASHQTGLDADIFLDVSPKPPLDPAARESVEPPRLVTPDGRHVDAARWGGGAVTLLRLAATLPGIDRVLVHPAIKRALCRDAAGERAWLRRIRPWWGHASHMHLHFRCPDDALDCRDLPPPPAGDGCDASLAWWFVDGTPRPPPPPGPPAPLPAACRALLDRP